MREGAPAPAVPPALQRSAALSQVPASAAQRTRTKTASPAPASPTAAAWIMARQRCLDRCPWRGQVCVGGRRNASSVSARASLSPRRPLPVIGRRRAVMLAAVRLRPCASACACACACAQRHRETAGGAVRCGAVRVCYEWPWPWVAASPQPSTTACPSPSWDLIIQRRRPPSDPLATQSCRVV